MPRIIHAYSEQGRDLPAQVAITEAGQNVYSLTVRGRGSPDERFIRLTSCQLMVMAEAIQAAFRPAHRP